MRIETELQIGHEIDRITSATLRSVTVQTIINNARRFPPRPRSETLSQAS
jgi:hypothetical protein